MGNNFQRLMEEEEGRMPPLPPYVKQNVQGSMGMFHFLGQVAELYIPRVFDSVVSALGGHRSDPPPPTSRRQPHEPPNGLPGGKGPGRP